MPKGQVRNHSSRALWVVSNDRGRPVARRLEPGHESPASVDADGFKAVDGTPIDGHSSWVKIVNLSTADVEDEDGALTRGCILCKSVDEHEFGRLRYEEATGWGSPI